MIEVIYKEENREEQEETAVQIPRNITADWSVR